MPTDPHLNEMAEHPLKLVVKDLPLGEHDSSEGWGDMDVQWIVTDETVGAKKHVVGLTVFPPGGRHHIHRHPHAEEAEYLLSGTGIARIGDANVRQNAGEMVFVPENDWHGFYNDGDEDAVLLWTYGGVPSLEAAGYVPLDEDLPQASVEG